MNKIIYIMIITFLSFYSYSFAEPKVSVPKAILLDFNSNEVLFEREPDEEIYPASMTKIMTSIVVFDLLKKNKISLDDTFVISDSFLSEKPIDLILLNSR